MTADEMFEELGYFKIEKDNEVSFINNEAECLIKFVIPNKVVVLIEGYKSVVNCTMQELKAINKKVEELRW